MIEISLMVLFMLWAFSRSGFTVDSDTPRKPDFGSHRDIAWRNISGLQLYYGEGSSPNQKVLKLEAEMEQTKDTPQHSEQPGEDGVVYSEKETGRYRVYALIPGRDGKWFPDMNQPGIVFGQWNNVWIFSSKQEAIDAAHTWVTDIPTDDGPPAPPIGPPDDTPDTPQLPPTPDTPQLPPQLAPSLNGGAALGAIGATQNKDSLNAYSLGYR